MWGWLPSSFPCLVLLIGLAIARPTLAQPQPLLLDPGRDLPSQGHLAMLRDPGGQLDAQAAASASGWQALPGGVSAGYTRDTLWLRLAVQRPELAQSRWLLQFSHALLDDVQLYRLDKAGRWRLLQHSGEDVGREHWGIDARNVQLPLELDSAAAVTLLLRLQSKNAMSTSIRLLTPELYAEQSRREYLYYGLCLGFGLLLIVFHLLFWQMTRERLSAWYLVYVSLALLIEAFTAGLPQQLLYLPVAISDPLLSLALCAALPVGLRFSFLQLNVEHHWPRSARAVLIGIGLLGLGAGALVLADRNDTAMLTMQSVSLLSIVGMVGAALLLLRSDPQRARVFLLVFGIYYLGVMVSFARNLGWLPANVWTNNAAALGTLLHMLLMSTRLNRRYELMRREKEAAQAHVVQMIGRHNERLEQEVRARTVDLRQEISQRQRLEDELRAALETERRAKQSQLDFVGMVSHEFRTPLAIINTTAQQIARNLDAAREKTLARCANLRSAAQRMTALVDEYLTADRMETSPFQPRTCQHEELLELLEDLVADWPDGRLRLQLGALPDQLCCDPGLLRVAVRNLLANADRHTPAGQAIELRAGTNARGSLHIAVSNPGVPVPPDEVPRLFEKYFRGRLAVQSPGAGLGLYMVRQIAELHGGLAQLESADAPVRFGLCLPGDAGASQLQPA